MLDVAFAADEAYAPHAATLLHSVLSSDDPATIQAHFLHPPDLSADTVQRVGAMVRGLGGSIRFHEIPPESVLGLPSMGRITQVMWYRLLLPELLPEVERVLYLDCDTLVVDTIGPLWEMEMKGCLVGAVGNVFPPDLLNRPEQLGIERYGYFNSGMLLMDLHAWRTTGCAGTIATLAREDSTRLIFPDQDALNIALADRRLPLHPRWNCQNSVFYYAWAEDVFGASAVTEARADPAIIHFEGPEHAKPWHHRSTHPYQQAYLEHRAGTPWPRVRFEGEPLRARLRRRLLGSAR